jgi:hypothetical protein
MAAMQPLHAAALPAPVAAGTYALYAAPRLSPALFAGASKHSKHILAKCGIQEGGAWHTPNLQVATCP